MARENEDRCGVPPLRSETSELVLLPGSPEPLSRAQVEQRCLGPLATLLTETANWPAGGFGNAWRIGDFNVLIVETTVAPGAEFYVQFWSEPNGPLAWEVSSGHCNRPLRKFITRRVRTALDRMGFEIGGGAGNFGKRVSIANAGDAAAVARDVVQIFWGAFGYRGGTPMVARVIRDGRCARAVVHRAFTLDDATTLLQYLGYETKIFKKGRRPVVGGRFQDFQFAVVLDVPAERRGEFQCLDFVTSVGHITDGSHAAWGEALNRLNGLSRVARGWIDDEGSVCIGTSLGLRGGMTEDEIGNTIAGWYRAATELRGKGAGPKSGGRKRKKPSEADDDPFGGLSRETPQARPVVH